MRGINFRYARYCTIYRAIGTRNVINDDLKQRRSCFHAVYPGFKQRVKQKITIVLFKNMNGVRRTADNNYCPFTKKQIREHLEYMKTYFNYEYVLNERNDTYEIEITVACIGIYLRMLLTWLRYLYECPNNFILYDVLKLKEMDEFKDIDPMCLHAYICNCVRPTWYDDQAINNGSQFVVNRTTEQIKSKIVDLLKPHEGKIFRTNDILDYKPSVIGFDLFNSIKTTNSELPLLQHDHPNGTCMEYNFNYWKKDFEKRLTVYKKYLKNFKDE